MDEHRTVGPLLSKLSTARSVLDLFAEKGSRPGEVPYELISWLWTSTSERMDLHNEIVESLEQEPIFRDVALSGQRHAATILTRFAFWMGHHLYAYRHPFSDKVVFPVMHRVFDKDMADGYQGKEERMRMMLQNGMPRDSLIRLQRDIDKHGVDALNVKPVTISVEIGGNAYKFGMGEGELFQELAEDAEEFTSLITERVRLILSAMPDFVTKRSNAARTLTAWTGDSGYIRLRDTLYANIRWVLPELGDALNDNINLQLALIGMHAGAFHRVSQFQPRNIQHPIEHWTTYRDRDGITLRLYEDKGGRGRMGKGLAVDAQESVSEAIRAQVRQATDVERMGAKVRIRLARDGEPLPDGIIEVEPF